MRRKAVTKSSPEKSRRSSRRGRKSPTVSPERAAENEERSEGVEETLEDHKSDNTDSEREEPETRRKTKGRRNVRSRAPEETTSKPRKSVHRKSQSVENSEKEESDKEENGEPAATKDSTVMETILEEKPEEVQDIAARSNEIKVHIQNETLVGQEPEDSDKQKEQVLNLDTVNGEEGTSVVDIEKVGANLCEQSRESGEVDSESIQDDESQSASIIQKTGNIKESSIDYSSSERIQQSVQTPKPPRKSRFRSRSRSPITVENVNTEEQSKPIDDKNDEELEAGEIKDDPVLKRSLDKKNGEEKPARKLLQRKRRWLSSKNDTKTTVITISTDSLKNIISEPVQPVPLADVKLESSPEPEEIMDSTEEQVLGERRRSNDKQLSKSSEKENVDHDILEEESKPKPSEKNVVARKISIVSDNGTNLVARPPSPARHHSSNILYITNLVRPFTVLQLKGLLARTGKIVENGFWIDKIKSKCYVKYETEDEAVETRHALHGVRWPTSNPKCLNVDFGTEGGMEKAIISTLDDTGSTRITIDNSKETKDFGWSRDAVKQNEDIHIARPVREWDLGKKEAFEHDRERAEGERSGRERDRVRDKDRDRDRERDRSSRIDEGRNERNRRRSMERDYGRDRDRRRNSASLSPARKFKKKENEPPIRLLDDLFRKTKSTPCIYWLPLTTEQIIEKDEQRRKNLAETQRRQEEARKHEEDRRKERDRRDRERRERVRSNSRDRRRRSRSRDDGRRRHR